MCINVYKRYEIVYEFLLRDNGKFDALVFKYNIALA